MGSGFSRAEITGLHLLRAYGYEFPLAKQNVFAVLPLADFTNPHPVFAILFGKILKLFHFYAILLE